MNVHWRHVAALGALCAAATTVRGQEESPSVPSGMHLTLQEVLEDLQPDGALWLRLRYVAPDMTRDSRAAMEEDFEALCLSQALAYQPVSGEAAAETVISIASAPVEFGANAPEVIQFFEVFRLADGTCIWEGF
ncbi:DUF6497 family protein [Pseudooceanicola onchidii]|uniref:DUF6497 family protein n=1 Tax=Pseudooceanicola onchidii TaxID=2562279 RepID=UPI0010AAAB9F|nr:DUF6497 family protein [Pseudooceanicola onchidii]